uniref:Major facilitator superfamily (MFS) profile domain-containing protein n=1 Tax=Photinus pyralis TaxID=7054 RepID=A0A1Y1L804_PHOPY
MACLVVDVNRWFLIAAYCLGVCSFAIFEEESPDNQVFPSSKGQILQQQLQRIQGCLNRDSRLRVLDAVKVAEILILIKLCSSFGYVYFSDYIDVSQPILFY